jgi:ATP-dependent exoDNAse (exonuclease V) beta subunit
MTDLYSKLMLKKELYLYMKEIKKYIKEEMKERDGARRKITLMTIHKSKGLEFNRVFVLNTS